MLITGLDREFMAREAGARGGPRGCRSIWPQRFTQDLGHRHSSTGSQGNGSVLASNKEAQSRETTAFAAV